MVCDRHEEIAVCLKDHSNRITKLEIADATILQRIENLTQSINELVGWLKIGILGVAGTGAGFVIWYIQTL